MGQLAPTPKDITSRLVIAARLLLLAAAGVATWFALATLLAPAMGGEVERAGYACPMHPEITSATEGDCPICGMALERISAYRITATQAPVPATSGADSRDRPGVSVPGWFVLPADIPEIARHDLARATPLVVHERITAAAWVEGSGMVIARLYRDEAEALNDGDHAMFVSADTPRASIAVHVQGPALDESAASRSRLRFVVDRRSDPLRPGQTGWIDLAPRERRVLAVPAPAIVESAEGPVVLVPASDGRALQARRVQLGRMVSGNVIVISGLVQNEHVVVMNAVFLNAERRLHETLATSGGPRP